ncbi:52 kDa repressor of the inhibitor of the protein kinase-like [Diabrotica undecimpunctata]|uniref:52 kDa repressor of the inhibitor of the protein kinase-like n=1 Tax=Diabrotica undecimpunctata TaxID=50387 RepID=UPI003B6370EB
MESIRENRHRLVPIIKTIILHGKQNIPLRGHRDDGSLIENENDRESIVSNEGNLRLKHHLKTTKANSTYISKTTCNEFILCCKTVILSRILEKLKDSRYCNIIFDETTDIAHIAQLSLAARHGDGKLHERFLGFVDIHKDNDCSENIDDEPQEIGKPFSVGGESCV